MSLSNKAAESKYNVKLAINGTVDIIQNDNSEAQSCHAETVLRVEVTGVGPTNEIQIYGRIRSSNLWHYIATITGEVTGIADISTYDFIRYFCSVADGTGELVASGFITNKSSGGGGGSGDASEAQQIIGNNYLSQINNKAPGNLLANKVFDRMEFSFTITEDIIEYYNGVTLTATVTVTYTDTTKATILNVIRS